MALMDVYTGSPAIPAPVGVASVSSKAAKPKREMAEVIVLSPESFDGEYERNGILYLLVLWVVSFWALITNFLQASFRKCFREKTDNFKSILWKMGRDRKHISSSFVDRFSRFNHQSKFGGAGWLSLDVFYNYWETVKPQLKRNLEGFVTKFWIEKMANRQAVTNRFKIVVSLLAEAFEKYSAEKEIRLVSIASGSAQAVIAAVLKCPHLNIKVVLIDLDREALGQARINVERAGLTDRFTIIRGTPKRLKEICEVFSPQIIEMVGFLDYLPKEKAISLISEIKSCLPVGGFFLTCNIRNNSEAIFLNWVLLWPMIYRSAKELSTVIFEGGFETAKSKVFYEPFRIHGICLCQK